MTVMRRFLHRAMPAARARIKPVLAAVLGCAGIVLPGPALHAQDVDPLATQARLSIGQQIAVDNGSLMGITPIDLMFRTGTRSQIFEFSTSMPVTENDPDFDKTFRLSQPNARLHYRRFVRDSSVSTTLSYSESDLDRESYYDDITGDLISLQGGKVVNSSAGLNYTFGSQSKLGAEFGLGYSRRDYVDTVDPGLYDSETQNASLRFYFEPIPTLRARVFASYNQVDSDGGTDSRMTRFGTGASMQLDKLTNLDAELRHDSIRRDYTDARGREDTSGPALSLGLTRARPTGDLSLNLSSAPQTGGRTNRLSLGRSFEMPAYNLSAEAGLVHFEGEIDATYQLAFNQDFRDRSAFSTSLSRETFFNNDGEKRNTISLSANYSRSLTDLSRISGAVRYRETDRSGGSGGNEDSLSFNIDYSHSLGSDISMVAGYRRTITNDSDDDDEDDDRLYLGLTRNFTWLP